MTQIADESEESLEELKRRLARLEHVRQTDLIRELSLFQTPLRDAASVRALMDAELAGWSDEQRAQVSPFLLGSPHFHVREWDYAGLDTPPRELYLPCWTVAHFPSKEFSVVYCDHGHGPGWGALEDDGWCSMDAVWNRSIKETIWRFRMLDGFAPGEQDLDQWIGPVRSLSQEEFDRVLQLAASGPECGPQLGEVWADYAGRVQRGERKPSLYLLGIFAGALERSSTEVQEVWVGRIMEGDRDLLKFPLFERWLFRRLKAGVLESRPRYARWLAECERLMTPTLILQLPEEARTAQQLLELALRHDPADHEALLRWIEVKALYINTSLHEIPSGVLWDNVRGATAEECDQLLEELEKFERRLPEDLRGKYAELIVDARFYYAAYKAHLTSRTGESFADRLAAGTWGPRL